MKIKTIFKNLSTYKKLFLCFLFITVLAISAIGIVSYKVMLGRFYNQVMRQAEETVSQLSSNLGSHCNLMITRVTNVATNPVVQEELNAAPSDVNIVEDYYYSRYKQIRFVLVQAFSSIYMEDMQLIGDNGADYYISLTERENIAYLDEIKEKARAAEGKAVFINTVAEDGYIELVKEIRNNLTRMPKGFVRASIKSSYIGKMARSLDFGADGKVIILDEENRNIVNDENVDMSGITVEMSGTDGMFTQFIGGKEYQVIYRIEQNTGWKTVALIPMAYFTEALSPLRNIFFVSIILTIVVCLLISGFLTRMIVRPVESTANAMKEFSEGDFSVRLEVDRKDEFGIMAAGFNKMVMQIESLLEQMTKAKVLQKELEFKTLQAQINPHFLYNALDMVNWMARKGGETDICKTVTALSNLMRNSIDNKEGVVTIAQELKFVEDYLYIQKNRYLDRIQVVYDIDQNLVGQMIPKFTIQPIVENSVVHGIEDSQRPCELGIKINREREDILIIVRDTGRGMSPEKVAHILDSPTGYDYQEKGMESHAGIGTYAVDRRLKYIYGEKYGLTAESKENVGTIITIRIPYLEDTQMLMKKLMGGNRNGAESNDIGR